MCGYGCGVGERGCVYEGGSELFWEMVLYSAFTVEKVLAQIMDFGGDWDLVKEIEICSSSRSFLVINKETVLSRISKLRVTSCELHWNWELRYCKLQVTSWTTSYQKFLRVKIWNCKLQKDICELNLEMHVTRKDCESYRKSRVNDLMLSLNILHSNEAVTIKAVLRQWRSKHWSKNRSL